MDDNYYVIEHGLLKNIGSAIKKGVSKLKGSQKKNHKYLRRELMPNGKYKYTYAEDVSDTNKYVYNTAGSNDKIKQWSINKKGAEMGEYSYKKGTVKSKHVTVEKKYYSTDKKIKGKKYTYKELTPKGWRYYYENADETKKNLDRAIAMAKQEKDSSEKSLSKARDAERMAYSNEHQLSNHGPSSGMNDKIKEKLKEAIAKLETKNSGASSAEKNRRDTKSTYTFVHKILSDQYVTNDEINNLIKSNKNNGQTNKIEKGRQKNRVKGKGKIKPNKKVSYKKKRVYKSKTLKNTIGKKVKYVESQSPELINTYKAYRR